MKRLYSLMIITLIFLLLCLLFAEQITLPAGIYVSQTKNTDGTLTFTVRTVTYNGAYAPRNSGVIWITDALNQFVKTIKVWAIPYRWTLVRWVVSSNNNVTGAITGASLNSHQLHSVTWNGRDFQNNPLAEGEYRVNVEFTEHNATVSNMGKFKSITFYKGPEGFDISYPNETYFRDLRLIWEPLPPANGTVSGFVYNFQSVGIAGANITDGSSSTTSGANGSYSLSLAPGTYSLTCSAYGYLSQIQNNVVVTSDQTTNLNFNLTSTSLHDDNFSPSTEVILYQNSPNPFLSNATFTYELRKAGDVKLDIYSIKGKHIKTLYQGYKKAGLYNVNWDRRDKNNHKAAAGNYLLKLTTPDLILYRKLTAK